jgi:parallel beta-helix repeat protein
MKKLLFTLLLGTGYSLAAQATEYFVSSGVAAGGVAAGSNTTGTGAIGSPYATIQFAVNKAVAGDFITVRQGTYQNADFTATNPSSPVVRITATNAGGGGTGKQLTIRAYSLDSQKPLIQFNGWQGFLIEGDADYVEINGFRIQGNNRTINVSPGVPQTSTSAAPWNQPGGCQDKTTPKKLPALAKYNGTGIATRAANGLNPDHIRIIGNEVFECGGAGIAFNDTDYGTIDKNTVYNNCWYNIYGQSGISINASKDKVDGVSGTMVVTHNRSFGNRLYVEWFNNTTPLNGTTTTGTCQGITDGNGIIIDKNDVFTTGTPSVKDVANSYSGTFLIANNLCVANGGAGIQVFKSSNADIINNTCDRNSRSTELRPNRGEIFLNAVQNVLVQNNILSSNASANTYGVTGTSLNNNISFDYNLFFDATNATTASTGTHIVAKNASNIFTVANPSLDPAANDYALGTGSAAINAGINNKLNNFDLVGNTRAVGTVDLGAYEVQTAGRTTLATIGPASTGASLDAYPNPFSGSATFAYSLDRSGPVRLEVVDLLGRRVALLVNETQPAGRHEARFEAPGRAAALYQVRLTTAAGTSAQQLSSQP